MTKRKAKRKAKREPSTAERITQARNKKLGIFQPDEPRTIHYVLDHLDQHLDAEGDPQEKPEAAEGDDGEEAE